MCACKVKKWVIEMRANILDAEILEGALGQEKCTRLSALTAAQNAKSLLSQQKVDLFTAGNVGRNTGAIRHLY